MARRVGPRRARADSPEPGLIFDPRPDGDASTARPAGANGVGTDEAVEYTCPMHPEIRRPGPGACPICGMALEPVTVSAEAGPSAELRDMTRRFWVSVVLTAPLFVLVMGAHLLHGIDALVPD